MAEFSSILPESSPLRSKRAWSTERPLEGKRKAPSVAPAPKALSRAGLRGDPSPRGQGAPPEAQRPAPLPPEEPNAWNPRTISDNLTLYLPGACPQKQCQIDAERSPTPSEPGSRKCSECNSRAASVEADSGNPSPPGHHLFRPGPGSSRSLLSVKPQEGPPSLRESLQASVNSPRVNGRPEAPQRQESKQSVAMLSNQDKATTSRKSTFTVAKTIMNQSTKSFERVAFNAALEPAMQLYLEDYCVDGPNAWMRAAKTIAVILGLLFALPVLSFATLMMPFPSPQSGFMSNWAFNFVAHPVLNYVPGRAQLELLSRIIEPAERHRVRWIVVWVPLVDPIVCLSIHSIASLFGVYPLPYGVVTGCIPGCVAALLVARLLVPKDLLTQDIARFMRFNLLNWLVWALQFVVLMIWLLAFPLLPPLYQAGFSFAVTGMLSGAGAALEFVARWMGLPKYYATEMKVLILFVAFLFTAALLSSSKSALVFAVMLTQEAGKALGILAKIWFYLTSIYSREMDNLDEEADFANVVSKTSSRTRTFCRSCWRFCSRSLHVKSIAKHMWLAGVEMSTRLRDTFADFKMHTRDSIHHSSIKVADARLLDHFARFFVLFAMVELCETLVPLIYIIVATALHIPFLEHNRQYFYIFKDMHLLDSIRGNSIAFLIEASIFVIVHMVLLRSIGFNLINFAGIVLRMDFWYWAFALGACCVAWATVLIAHTGHDLDLIRSWLSF